MERLDVRMDILDRTEMEPTPSFISKQVLRGRYLVRSLAPDPTAATVVVCAGWEECSLDFRIDRKGFPYVGLELIVRGRWRLRTGERESILEQGTVFAYEPQMEFTLSSEGKEPGLKYFVDIAGTDSVSMVRTAGFHALEPFRIREGGWFRELLDQILDCSSMSETGAGEVSACLLRALLLRTAEERRSQPARQSTSMLAYQRCLSFIRDRYAVIQSVSEVAAGCHVSPAYLSRLFAAHGNERASDLLLRLKMGLAAQLCMRGNRSVKEIAGATGYQDPYHFSRVFKRFHGVAPSLFVK